MFRRIPAAAVPSITALRKELGYSDQRQTGCQIFYDDVRTFRNKFVASNGIKGKDLHQWRDTTHQNGLTEMVTSFLDTHGNGDLFWPTESFTENHNALVYADDYREIRSLVTQLFFRLNLQQYRNEKYRGKSTAERPNSEGRGASTDDPIDVDDEMLAAETNATISSAPAYMKGRFRVRSSTVESETNRAKASMPQSSSEHSIPEKTRAPNAPVAFMDEPIEEQSRKRRRLDSPPASGPISSTMTCSKDRDSYIVTLKARKSPRRQRARRLSGRASEAMVRDAIGSPTPAPTSSEAPSLEHAPANAFLAVVEAARQRRAAAASERLFQGPPSAAMENSNIPVPSDASDPGPPAPPEPLAPTIPTSLMPPPPSPTPHLPTPTPPTPQAPSKPRIIFNYRVISSRAPCFESTNWTPEGRFTDKTLPEIKKEIPLDVDTDPSAKGLLFTLKAPGVKIKFGILNGNDDKLPVMKQEFNDAIRDQIPRLTGSEALYVNIDIEALRNEEQVKTEEPRWDGDIDW